MKLTKLSPMVVGVWTRRVAHQGLGLRERSDRTLVPLNHGVAGASSPRLASQMHQCAIKIRTCTYIYI